MTIDLFMEIRKYLNKLESLGVVVIGSHLDKDGYKKLSLALSEEGKELVMRDSSFRILWLNKDYKKMYEYVRKLKRE